MMSHNDHVEAREAVSKRVARTCATDATHRPVSPWRTTDPFAKSSTSHGGNTKCVGRPHRVAMRSLVQDELTITLQPA